MTATTTINTDDKEHRAFLRRLRADLKTSIETLEPGEARYLVDLYYQLQENRITAKNQVRSGEDEEPNYLLAWVGEEFAALENQIKSAMNIYTDRFPVTRWMKSITGVGPVIAAGIFAQIDITKAPTAGSIWRYAGLDPTISWMSAANATKAVNEYLNKRKLTEDLAREIAISRGKNADTVLTFAMSKGDGSPRKLTKKTLASALARRPHNARLKTLLWKFATCQVKCKGHENSFYGPHFDTYKAGLVVKNERGDFATAAAEVLEAKPNHAQKKIYKEGKLPPGHLNARALRWLSKLFISHLHTIYYQDHYGEPAPKPYVIAHLGHVHMIEPPVMPSDADQEAA